MFAVRPNPKKAAKELRTNLLVFASLCLVVRAVPYVLAGASKALSKR
jgi:hypothetical protein